MMMVVWFLVMWAPGVEEFEGGRYLTYERCMEAGRFQSRGFPPYNTHLSWRCEQQEQ